MFVFFGFIARYRGARSALSNRSNRLGDSGFTLVELLVVMVILVMLASIVGPRVIGYLGSSKIKTAKVQIESIASAMELFRIDNGRYPSTSEGLPALVIAPDGMKNWNGPYLTKIELPIDPWGNPFRYAAPGQKGTPFDIISFGAGNKPGGEGEDADVSNH